MSQRQKHRSSHFSMAEDVYLLTKSAPSLTTYDDDGHHHHYHDTDATHPEFSSSYATTPRMKTPRRAPKITNNAVDDSDRTTTPFENRLNSISTILSSLFGGLKENQPEQATNAPSGFKRNSEQGIYRFFQKDFSAETNLFMILCYILVLFYSVLICVGPILLAYIIPKGEWCGQSETESDAEYANPDYITDLCRYLRVPQLFFLTMEECDMSRRLLCSVILGGIIGYERRSADRPAGVRCMSMVSLGAASFTISSIMAFRSSPMGWDASRVAAALPSGVGFLGGALIWKGSVFVNGVGEVQQVKGLTTATSVWLSAAVGVGCGGALYLVTTYVVILVIMILRYAPRSYLIGLDIAAEDGNDDEADGSEGSEEQQSTSGDTRGVWKTQQQYLQRKKNLIKMLSESELDGNNIDIQEEEEMDKVPSMRNASSHGLLEYAAQPSPSTLHRSPSNQMLKSRSTGSLHASLRARVPTFGE